MPLTRGMTDLHFIKEIWKKTSKALETAKMQQFSFGQNHQSHRSTPKMDKKVKQNKFQNTPIWLFLLIAISLLGFQKNLIFTWNKAGFEFIFFSKTSCQTKAKNTVYPTIHPQLGRNLMDSCVYQGH